MHVALNPFIQKSDGFANFSSKVIPNFIVPLKTFSTKSGNEKDGKKSGPEMFQFPLIACHLPHEASFPYFQTATLL